MSDPRDDRIRQLEAELKARDAEIEKLKAQVAELLERLNQNSSNSHKPPSSDPPGNRKERRAKDKRQRKRGARKGHKGTRRELLPPDEVDEFVDHYPDACENCWRALEPTPDPGATRYQFTEVPPIKPHTTEHRRHAVTCPHCRHKTRAPYDEKVIPASPLGPRLVALIALFTGVYHLSRRKTQSLLSDVLGVRVSLGGISRAEARASEALKPAVAEAWEAALQGDVKHTDGTSWFQSGASMALWTIATSAVTVFRILANGAKATLEPLFGQCHGIMVSDRAKALTFWAMHMRQICWAHLLRKFVSFSERDGPVGKLGEELLELTAILFDYWRDLRDGKMTRERYVAWMAPLQKQVEAALAEGVALGVKGVSGSCADILEHRQALWTFVEREDVDPTNNHGERELRGFVLWRKRSFGTQSDRGSRFAERVMTIAHTARKQSRNVLAFLTAACKAHDSGGSSPSLFDPTTR